MLKTLYQKLFAVLLCCVVVMIVIFVLVMRHLDMARGQELNQKLYRSLAAELVREQIVPEHDGLEPGAVQSLFDRLRKINPRLDVYLLDADGRVLAASTGAEVRRPTVDVAPIERFLDDNAALPILGDDPADHERARVFSAAPVRLEGQREGYLYLVLRGLISDGISQRIKNSYVLRESLAIVGLGLVFVLLASTLIIRLITRPLQRLNVIMEKLRQGGFGVGEGARTQPRPGDEIAEITDMLNRMADRILHQMKALKETDAQRRELIANISHDLRTPLASLQGYLETLQFKRDRLTLEEQTSYLEIALRHTEQLGRLVSQLFELAKLDSEQAQIYPEPFVLDELVQDTVQEFRLQAENASIALEVSAPQELPLVYGEIGLIERVLRNLIENALRYTAPGGSITVSLRPGTAGVAVEILDNGRGIAPEDLSRIFDGFYRGEKSRRDAAGHAGLGLAIAKRIIELHHRTITAESRPGMTAIRFELPCAGEAGASDVGARHPDRALEAPADRDDAALGKPATA